MTLQTPPCDGCQAAEKNGARHVYDEEGRHFLRRLADLLILAMDMKSADDEREETYQLSQEFICVVIDGLHRWVGIDDEYEDDETAHSLSLEDRLDAALARAVKYGAALPGDTVSPPSTTTRS